MTKGTHVCIPDVNYETKWVWSNAYCQLHFKRSQAAISVLSTTRTCLQNAHTKLNNPFSSGRAWGRTLETILFLTEASSTSVVLVPDPGIASQHLHLRAMWCVKHPFDFWNYLSFYPLHLEMICFTMQEAYWPFYITKIVQLHSPLVCLIKLKTSFLRHLVLMQNKLALVLFFP